MGVLDHSVFGSWIARRDAQAFQTIVERHARMVYATCRRILRNESDAEDVAQECFEALVTAEPGRPRELGAWLHGMATNKCLMRLRAETRRKARETAYAARQEERPQAQLDDVYAYVDEAIAELPNEVRSPVVAHFLCGQSHREIARVTGVSRRTVGHRIEKGIDLIGESLRKRGITVPAVTLASLLGSELAEAVVLPAKLAATLGKLALAHSAGATVGATVSGSAWSLLTSALFANKVVAATVALSAVVGGLWLTQRVAERYSGESAQQPPSLQQPGASSLQPGSVDQVQSESAQVQPESTAQSPGDETLAAISGTARYMGLRKPAPEVRVRLYWERHGTQTIGSWVDETFTDENGNYRFSGLTPDSKYSVHASTVEEGYGAIVEGPEVRLTAGELRTGVDITVATGGSISGKVMDKSLSYHPSRLAGLGGDLSREPFAEKVFKTLIQVADKPLADVQIVLARTGSHSPLQRTVSGVDGRYEFRGFPPGRYDVWAEPPEGAVRVEPNHGDQFRTLTAEPDGHLEVDFSFRFDGFSITGCVRSGRGVPIKEAEVTAAPVLRGDPAADGTEERLGAVLARASCDENGVYRLDGLCPADIRSAWAYLAGYALARPFILRASAEGYAPAQITVPSLTESIARDAKASRESINRLMASMDVEDEGKPASPIDVVLPKGRGNDITGVDFVLEPETYISGRLVDASGQCPPNARIRIAFAEAPPPKPKALTVEKIVPDWTKTSETGQFLIAGVPSGRFLFEVDAPPLGMQRAKNAPIEVRPGESVTGLEIIVEAPEERGTIKGRVVETGSRKAIPEFRAEMKTEKSHTSHDFKDGALLIEHVVPGSATLKIEAAGYATEEIGIEVASGRETLVDLQLVPEGVLEGYVTRNGEPSAHGYVTAWFANERREASSWAQTDKEGHYKLGALKPGNYRVRVTMWLYEDQRGGAQVQDVAWVQVRQGVLRRDFDYRGDCTVRGTFAGPDDLRWHVSVIDGSLPDDGQLRATAWKFEKQGRYEIGSLPAGNYTVVAQCGKEDESGSNAVCEHSEAVSLRPGQTAEVHFDLR